MLQPFNGKIFFNFFYEGIESDGDDGGNGDDFTLSNPTDDQININENGEDYKGYKEPSTYGKSEKKPKTYQKPIERPSTYAKGDIHLI